MPIVIACPICQQKIRAPENVIGRQIKCPQCKAPFTVDHPPVEPVAPKPTGKLSPEIAPEPFAIVQPAPSWTPADPVAMPPTAAAPPIADTPRRTAKGNALVDVLLFRRMVAPSIVIVVFYLGLLGIVGYGIFNVILGILMLIGTQKGSGIAGLIMILIAVFGGIVSLLIWRISCELVLVLFRIHDELRLMRRDQSQSGD
jgi:hypothetical protein